MIVLLKQGEHYKKYSDNTLQNTMLPIERLSIQFFQLQSNSSGAQLRLDNCPAFVCFPKSQDFLKTKVKKVFLPIVKELRQLGVNGFSREI